MNIKLLSNHTINKIAAGEVIERPASVIKELVENSIDSGAKNIDIIINSGGRNYISVKDDGSGIAKEDLSIAVLRHTTSKLDETNIDDIKHLGFRGEALASIGAVSRMSIASKKLQTDEGGWVIEVNGGEISEIAPSPIALGTHIIVSDLFFTTPARLKFLKTEKAETAAIIEIIKKLALANAEINFTLKVDNKEVIANNQETPSFLSKMEQLIGKEFIENNLAIQNNYNEINISGFISHPTFNKAHSNDLFLFVNNRPIKDKILTTCVKIAYQDFLSPNRHPTVVLFINLPSSEVDVNVHPTKAEVRFRDTASLRSLIISSIRSAITASFNKTSTTIATKTLESFTPGNNGPVSSNLSSSSSYAKTPNYYLREDINPIKQQQTDYKFLNDIQKPFISHFSVRPSENLNRLEQQSQTPSVESAVSGQTNQAFPMGAAKCQLNETYIISQTAKSVIIVDQHAAHERIVYEKLKQFFYNQNEIKTQRLLIPQIIELDEHKLELIIDKIDEFKKLGLFIEKFGNNAIKVSEVPSLIATNDIQNLIQDIVANLVEHEEDNSFNSMLNEILATFACHHSIRKGRVLNLDEMNSLLRSMEETPGSSQCNHGRPTFIELKLSDIENLFERN
jgi:DNA mismatch repair protein MutL